MEADGAAIISGNTDIAVADFDYARRRFPWMTDGVPDIFRAAAEWAHDELGDERIAWLRRLPSERRLRAEDGTMILVCHASPGSQTAGFDRGLDPNVIIERASGTDARVIACGHTHIPEVRDLGWKLIVNDGSAGYVFDGDPTASWARIDIDDETSTAEIKRTEFDASRSPTRSRRAASRATSTAPRRSAPGNWSDDRPTTGRGDRDGPRHHARERRRRRPGRASSPAAPGSGLIESFDPSRLTARIAGEVHDLDASGILDRKELRRTDRYIQFALVAAREALDQAGLPERFEGDLAERTGVILGTGLGGVGTLIDGFTTNALRGPDRISPFLIPMGIPNIGAGQIAIQFGMTGPNFTTVVGLCHRRPRPR